MLDRAKKCSMYKKHQNHTSSSGAGVSEQFYSSENLEEKLKLTTP